MHHIIPAPAPLQAQNLALPDLIHNFHQPYVKDVPDDDDIINLPPPSPTFGVHRVMHPILDGTLVDSDGNEIPPDNLPLAAYNIGDDTGWTPFE
ncbi:hypothetical protein EW146_g9711, partial [Bondarzewia mesenterica]